MTFWWTVRGVAVVVGALVLYPMLLLLGKIGYSNIPADIYLAEKVQVGPANAVVPSGSALCYSSNRICPMYTTNSGPSSPGAPSCSCWVDNFGDFWGPDQELGSCKSLKKSRRLFSQLRRTGYKGSTGHFALWSQHIRFSQQLSSFDSIGSCPPCKTYSAVLLSLRSPETMAPLILHNVPDDELYVGDDGIKRPYAMVFPQSVFHNHLPPPSAATDMEENRQDGSLRARKAVNETGSFGKSTRRARSKTATPARKEDPTIAAADKIFSNWIANQAPISQAPAPSQSDRAAQNQRRPSLHPSTSQQNLSQNDEKVPPEAKFIKAKEPTEVILRGYRSAQQQYAAINHYEQLAGRICEDYSRDPPVESRRYKSELRDPAFARRKALTPEERAKVNKADSGLHWVKVTFESAEAAEAAIYASPQIILGHQVFAEPYTGLPPPRDEAVPDPSIAAGFGIQRTNSGRRQSQQQPRAGTAAAAGFNPAWLNPDSFDSGFSHTSSHTADTGTAASTDFETQPLSRTVTPPNPFAFDNIVAEQPRQQDKDADDFCRLIPEVRKVKLLPMEQALLPAPSVAQRVAHYVPFISWFNGAMIGTQVPRTELGEFDWVAASLYWKFLWWLDFLFGLFGGDIRKAADQDD
ncbi:uncharacterized protein PODANS_1_19490 [Podospora anserina S mat+]|uniref:Podospora anserina S mat+ genomic DNA chromosome 1, supercontig 4 n=2 Tax=Podospora anserina TaxID=2587412 RepID=B2AUL2_PODAN|nr:uncharacterized protein PODANS_1_19490 [Podospora anserina S mat+]CAP68085.1 unnamed protein product [Podospora anserina S mat+]CDN29869.1 Putative protein of unknown function [Podospora anserina]CDP24341.1 Putative protein of unknown function [Podospora anserina S mat+]